MDKINSSENEIKSKKTIIRMMFCIPVFFILYFIIFFAIRIIFSFYLIDVEITLKNNPLASLAIALYTTGLDREIIENEKISWMIKITYLIIPIILYIISFAVSASIYPFKNKKKLLVTILIIYILYMLSYFLNLNQNEFPMVNWSYNFFYPIDNISFFIAFIYGIYKEWNIN